MFIMALWVTVFAVCFAVMGAPIVILLSRNDTQHRLRFALLLAPAFGMSIYLAAAVWLHYFGVTGRTAFVLLLFAALVAIAMAARSAPIVLPALTMAIAVVALGGVTAGLLNGLDYRGSSLFNYFPLTNDDTFTYLGHIDQIRGVGWYKPQFIYPAQLFATFLDISKQRFPDATLIADLADTFGIQTHIAFFLVQRLAVAAIGLAAAGLAGWLTNNAVTAALGFFITICGNFLLHQCLQQFASSLLGGVAVLPLLWLVAWTLPAITELRHRVIGTSLTATLLGAMALASPEGHTFYLLTLGTVFLVVTVARRQWNLLGILPSTILIYAVVTLPLLTEMWTFLISQIGGRSGAGPGDWVAAPSILVQYSGVRLVGNVDIRTYPALVIAASVIFATTLFAALAFLVPRAWSRGEPHALVSIVAPGLIFVVGQIGLYATGRGYILLKTIDYSTPLLPVIVAVGVFMVMSKRAWRHHELLAVASVGAIWFAVAISEKFKLFDTYRKAIVAMPTPESYLVTVKNATAPRLIFPDLEREVLNLFIYINRFGADRIGILAAASNRYQTVSSDGGSPALIARTARLGIAGLPLADITGKQLDPDATGLQILPAGGQILIQRGGGWLDPEGSSISGLFRWLGGSGDFVVLDPSAQKREMILDLAPGPDLNAANTIEILVGGQLVASLHDLPERATFRVALPEFAGMVVPGKIRIAGPQAGPRQLSVVSIATTPVSDVR